MMLTCPGVGAAPMIRMPDALESSIQKATDLGAIGIIVPTVDDALEARDAARFSRYPPFGRRSSGGGSFGQVWPGVNYRATVNDNMLVTVMIETLEGVANAEEIAATHGVDVVLIGNNDLSSFSGWSQNDPRYQDALIKVHDAALKYGKYFGNAGAQYLNGYVLSADTRMVQNGPARDGWTPPARGGGPGRGAAPAGRGRGDGAPEPDPEPVIGLPGRCVRPADARRTRSDSSGRRRSQTHESSHLPQVDSRGVGAPRCCRPSLDAEAALPQAKITRIRLYEAPTVMPLQIPLLQSNMVVTIETDANITGIGEGGTLDTLRALRRTAHREEPVPHRAPVAGHVSRLPLSARARTAARDRRPRPGAVGSERQGAGRAGVRAAGRDEPQLSRVLHDDVPRRRQHAARSRRGLHGGRLAPVPLRCRQPAAGHHAATTPASACARCRPTAAPRAKASARAATSWSTSTSASRSPTRSAAAG